MSLQQAPSLFCLVTATILFCHTAHGDVVLTFDQAGVANSVLIDQDYGDRVTASSDSNGHAYDIITGNGLGLTPNVLASYQATSPELWTTGYGDLTNVYYNEADGSDSLALTLAADAGFQVGLFGFEAAAFGGGETVAGIEVRDGNDNVLWSVGPTAITGASHNDFDFAGGIFANSLTLEIDLTGLGGRSDNVGIDNVQFGQVSAVPEPTGILLAVVGCLVTATRRRKHV